MRLRGGRAADRNRANPTFTFIRHEAAAMKVIANTLRSGNVLEHEGRRYQVIKHELILPGKGNAFIALDMRDVMTGTKTNVRFRTGDSVERLQTDERDAQYLFMDGDFYTFMDNETYDQFTIDKDQLGDKVDFLMEGMKLRVNTVDGSPVGITLPTTVTLEVAEADPVVKGQTASASYKPAVLENGIRISVPPHIATGTRVVVHTENREYVERAKD
jgi:elongation factor P